MRRDSRHRSPAIDSLEPRRLFALVAPDPEFHINTTAAGAQVFADVAVNTFGNFVAVWASIGQDGDQGGIYMQQFLENGTEAGPETRVNVTTAGNQQNPAVAMDAGGNFVVVWENYDVGGIYSRRFDINGNPLSATDVRVTSSITGRGQHADVAMNAFGAFVVTWEGVGVNAGDRGIFARAYNSDGVTSVNTFRANTDLRTTTGTSIDIDDNGNFVLAWTQYWSTPGGAAVPDAYAQKFNSAGVSVTPIITVNTLDVGEEADPKVAILPGGGFVVTFTDASNTRDGLGSGNGVYLQRFDPNGTKLGGETRVNTTLAGDQRAADVVVDNEGHIVVTWLGANAGGIASDILAQQFDLDGNRAGTETRINTTLAGDQYAPAAAIDKDGELVIVWHSNTQDNDGSAGVYGRQFIVTTPDTTPPTVSGSLYDVEASKPRLLFSFSEAIDIATLTLSDLLLKSLTTGQTIDASKMALSYNNETLTAVVSFPGLLGGVLADGNWRVTLAAGSVVDVSDNALAATYTYDFFVLAGDANRDRVVDFNDLVILAQNYNKTGLSFRGGNFDYSAGGGVDFNDLVLLAQNYGKSVLQPAPALAIDPPASKRRSSAKDVID